MSSDKNLLVQEIKESLLAELDEWLGFDIPDEGTEDHDHWQERLKAINSISDIDDVLSYAEGYVIDPDGFLRKWGLSNDGGGGRSHAT